LNNEIDKINKETKIEIYKVGTDMTRQNFKTLALIVGLNHETTLEKNLYDRLINEYSVEINAYYLAKDTKTMTKIINEFTEILSSIPNEKKPIAMDRSIAFENLDPIKQDNVFEIKRLIKEITIPIQNTTSESKDGNK